MSLRRLLLPALPALATALLALPAGATDTPGAAYVLSNSPAGNSVLVFDRAADGALTAAGSVPAGGVGTGGGLGSQGAIVVSRDGRFVFAVNAGSNSVSSFRTGPRGLELADTVSSGGTRPTSVTYENGLLYVLNAGAPNSISGFSVDAQGDLAPIAGSTRPLSAAQTNPAQVQFSPDADVLVVTERTTNTITTYAVGSNGVAGTPTSYPSLGAVPFGFAFAKRGQIVVSDAAGASGASSYEVASDGTLETLMAIAPTGQQAACWTVVTKNGKYAYVTNAATGNVSGFAIDQDGSLSLLDANGITGVTGGNPTDAALSVDSHYLYIRNGNQSAINVFRVADDGSLTGQAGIGGLPAGAAGIAVR